MIAEDSLARALVRRLAVWVLATPAALRDDGSDARPPIGPLVDVVLHLRPWRETVGKRGDARAQHAETRRFRHVRDIDRC